MNVETFNEEISPSKVEVFHEILESFLGESSSSSLNDDVQQHLEKATVPSSNTQTVENDIVPNIDEERYGVYAWRMLGKCLGLHKGDERMIEG
ncbi:hypothetical protein Tco_0361376 [Tanacetum coccineum]